MAYYKYKAKATDDLTEAHEIVRNVGKMIEDGKIDKRSTLDNLGRALKKIEGAKYWVDRE